MSRAAFRLFLVCCVGVGGYFWSGCGDEIPQPVSLCQSSADCPQQQPCIQNICVGGTLVSAEPLVDISVLESVASEMDVDSALDETEKYSDTEEQHETTFPETEQVVNDEDLEMSSPDGGEPDVSVLQELNPDDDKTSEQGDAGIEEPKTPEEPRIVDNSPPADRLPPPEPGGPEADCLTGQIRSCYQGPAGTQGVGICRAGQQACVNGKWGTCTGQVLPGAKEVCGDALDNNCNGKVDEDCPCFYNNNRLGVCATATWDGLGTCRKPATYSATEICKDGLDNNCNGVADELCSCAYLGKNAGICLQARSDANGRCREPVGYSALELCDGIDNNCDGQIDEGNPGGGGACQVPTAKGECKQGTYVCQSGIVQCRSILPQTEVCDGKDNNCDGLIDNIAGILCTVLFAGICRQGKTVCVNKQKVCDATATSPTQPCASDASCAGACPAHNKGYTCLRTYCQAK